MSAGTHETRVFVCAVVPARWFADRMENYKLATHARCAVNLKQGHILWLQWQLTQIHVASLNRAQHRVATAAQGKYTPIVSEGPI